MEDWTAQSIITIIVGVAATAGLLTVLLWTMAHTRNDE